MLRVFGFLNIFKLILIFLLSSSVLPFNKSKSVYLFLKLSGPTFIKLGQLLATRSDLVGEIISKKLEIFQDKLPPFPCKKANQIIQKEFQKHSKDLFLDFSQKPVAAASIAQVYKCKTIYGEDVAVKILRPNIVKIINRDIFTLKLIAQLFSLFSAYYSKKTSDIVGVLEFCANRELDLLNEASVGSQLKDNLSSFDGVYIPKIYWELSTKSVLTTEWIDGIPLSDSKRINNSKINKIKAAENLVISYFNQVYRDGFFHADMHPGNLFLMNDSRIAIVDFGIIGIIDKKTRLIIAQILISFLKRDYLRVAKLHIEAGLIPKDVNLVEFSLNCRIIGESVVGKSVGGTSFADLLAKLLNMTRKYDMKTSPELLLLQKTIMLVEGVGVSLNKDLNIWDISQPWIKEWAKTNIGFDSQMRDNYLEFIERIKSLPILLKDSIEVSNKSNYLMTELTSVKKKKASWQFIGLLFFSLWAISILSRYNIFN